MTKNTKDMGKYVKHIKIAKNLRNGSLAAMVVFLNNRKFNFNIFNLKNFENQTIYTRDMEKYVKNGKIAKNLQKGSLTFMVLFFNRPEI